MTELRARLDQLADRTAGEVGRIWGRAAAGELTPATAGELADVLEALGRAQADQIVTGRAPGRDRRAGK